MLEANKVEVNKVMHNITIEELEQLLQDGRRALQYAWEHYDELISRETIYTLYGPHHYGIDAGIPGKFIPQRVRKLSKQTRRKNYTTYELDSAYQLLCTTPIREHTIIDCVYYCFMLDGVQYACSFCNNEKKLFRDEVIAIKYEDNRPQWYAFLRSRSLIINYFDYSSPEKMNVSAYSYSPDSKYTMHGCLTDLNAPIGALNSPVNWGQWEEDIAYTDFSSWV